MAIFLDQVFATAVENWYAAAAASLEATGEGSAPAAWATVIRLGRLLTIGVNAATPEIARAELVAAAQAILDGEAIVFGGQLIRVASTGRIAGALTTAYSGEIGAATAVGIGSGLILSVAILIVGAYIEIQLRNKHDYETTMQAARQLYTTQYLPRYLRSAMRRIRVHPYVSEPISFAQFVEHRGEKLSLGNF